jgi:hypothetical protein
MDHVVNQPPLFPAYRIPACPKGEKFAYNIMPAFVKLPFTRKDDTERYFTIEDGRKSATSLLNPAAFPGTRWESQVQDWSQSGFQDQVGNNLNSFGCFWSLTRPDEEEKLDEEIKIFKGIVNRTMEELVKQGEIFAAEGNLKAISPRIHFAMDYFGKQAQWHMTSEHMVHCGICGERVKEGIAYHKNSMGEKCIVDVVKYKQLIARQRQIDRELAEEVGEEAAGALTPLGEELARAETPRGKKGRKT